jgi:hypothetical protein
MDLPSWECMEKGVDSPGNPNIRGGGALVGSWIVDTSSETSVGMRKLVETIEQPFIDVITDTQKCVKVFRQINGSLAKKDN